MRVLEKMHRHMVPSHHNSYRPHLLRKQSLIVFIVLILASESVFVTGLFVQQSGFDQQIVAAVAAAPVGQGTSFFNTIGRQLARMAVNSEPMVPWMLSTIALLLTVLVLVMFLVHIQIQQPEMLFSGITVAIFAVSLIITNSHIVGML